MGFYEMESLKVCDLDKNYDFMEMDPNGKLWSKDSKFRFYFSHDFLEGLSGNPSFCIANYKAKHFMFVDLHTGGLYISMGMPYNSIIIPKLREMVYANGEPVEDDCDPVVLKGEEVLSATPKNKAKLIKNSILETLKNGFAELDGNIIHCLRVKSKRLFALTPLDSSRPILIFSTKKELVEYLERGDIDFIKTSQGLVKIYRAIATISNEILALIEIKESPEMSDFLKVNASLVRMRKYVALDGDVKFAVSLLPEATDTTASYLALLSKFEDEYSKYNDLFMSMQMNCIGLIRSMDVGMTEPT